MMKQIFTILMLIIGINHINAQWYQVNTNTTENLHDIFFVDSLEGYCVGGSDDWGTPQSRGVILKTTDGGENWSTIFSKDSLSIRSIAIVEVSGNKKLFAFGLKDGVSYLVSTFINTPFQNWSINSISYKPKGVKVYNNEIFFVDEIDYLLKKMTNGTMQTVTSQTVSIFDINHDGLIFINDAVDSIFYTENYNPPFTAFPSHPTSVFSNNQITNAQILKKGDTLLIKGTYPGMVLYSLDASQTWSYNLNAPEFKSFIDITNWRIYSVTNSGKIMVSVDFGNSWNEETSVIGSPLHTNLYFNGIVGYIFSENGEMYKNNSLTVGSNETEFKKKINIYPNPAKDVMQIEVSDNFEIESIEFFDMNGKRISVFGKNERTLNVSSLISGAYLLKISTQEGEIAKKVLIE